MACTVFPPFPCSDVTVAGRLSVLAHHSHGVALPYSAGVCELVYGKEHRDRAVSARPAPRCWRTRFSSLHLLFLRILWLLFPVVPTSSLLPLPSALSLFPQEPLPPPNFLGGLPSPWLPQPGLLCAHRGLPGPAFWPSPFHPPLPGSTRDLITLPPVNGVPAPAIHISAGPSSLGFNHTFLHC